MIQLLLGRRLAALALSFSLGVLLQLLVRYQCSLPDGPTPGSSETGLHAGVHPMAQLVAAPHRCCWQTPCVPLHSRTDTCTRAAFMYVLVPMPYLFFGAGQGSGYNSSLASGCELAVRLACSVARPQCLMCVCAGGSMRASSSQGSRQWAQ